jgi:hypothetical protein
VEYTGGTGSDREHGSGIKQRIVKGKRRIFIIKKKK